MTTPDSGTTLETWRLLIIRRDGDEILVVTAGEKCALPQVDIPTQQRIAANINRAVERGLGLRVISLYEVVPCDAALNATVPYHAVAAVPPTQAPPAGMQWACTQSLTEASFSRDGEFAAIDAFRSKFGTGRTDGAVQPFLKPNWFTEVKNWVGRSLRPHSLRLSGEFQQFNASLSFSLIRFGTTGEPVWFKAVGEPNIREWSVTLALGRLGPAFIPQILASKRNWNAWLTLQAPGKSLTSSGETQFWQSAASSLSSLQIACTNDSQRLLRAGAHDLRVSRLLSILDFFFQFAADCTGRLPLQCSNDLTLLEISDLKNVVRIALQDLESLHLTDSVGHMDLNPGNIFVTSERAVFLDWAEAFVGSPLFSFEYLLQHFHRVHPREPIQQARFRNAYLQPWRKRISSKDLERALSLSPLAALFAYAATIWSSADAEPAQQPFRERYLLRLLRKMKSEAQPPEAERVSL